MTVARSDDTRDWVAIRHAYETSPETLRQICSRLGVTKGALEHRCNRERWLPRHATLGKRQDSTLARLFSVLEAQVTKLANATGDTLGDKEAQQLTELIKNFEKISNMAGAEDKADTPRQRRDIRDLRDKLAKRIDQFIRR